MAKRRAVPTALHAELSEYSSLLRALRTTGTLDLSSHLLQSVPGTSRSTSSFADDDVSLIDDEEAVTTAPPPTESTSPHAASKAVSSSSRSQLEQQTSVQQPSKAKTGNAKERDTWTRWPLLAGDVHVPEFSLADEVGVALKQALGKTSNSRAPSQQVEDDVRATTADPDAETVDPSESSLSDEEDNIHPALSHQALRILAVDTSAFLTRILALLTAHVPAAEKSMQNRIRPINWETVIDVACAHGAITTSTAQSVRERMSRLYTPSTSNVVHRVEHLHLMKQGLSDALRKHDNALLALPVQHQKEPLKPAKRKRGPYKKQQSSAAPPKRRRKDPG